MPANSRTKAKDNRTISIPLETNITDKKLIEKMNALHSKMGEVQRSVARLDTDALLAEIAGLNETVKRLMADVRILRAEVMRLSEQINS